MSDRRNTVAQDNRIQKLKIFEKTNLNKDLKVDQLSQILISRVSAVSQEILRTLMNVAKTPKHREDAGSTHMQSTRDFPDEDLFTKIVEKQTEN